MPHRKGGKESTKYQRAWQAANLSAHAEAQRRYEASHIEECRRRKRELWRIKKYRSKTIPEWARGLVGNQGRKNIGKE